MSLYLYEKFIEETRKLAAVFLRTIGTMPPVSGENARYDVSHHLDLELSKKHSAEIDAIGRNTREGLRVQIKSRAIPGGGKTRTWFRSGSLNRCI